MIFFAGSGICAEGNPALPDIRRKMTLNDISRDFGVPSVYLMERLKLPALVMSVIPFGLAGTVLALLLTGIPLGATLIIGILVVIALTVNQGVLLITFTESLRINDKLSPWEAIITAAKLRLRPVLMLSFCFIAGLIPLALNIEEGGDMLQPMAAGAIGGLALGLMVTLFLLPSLYLIFTAKSKEGTK